MRQIFRLKEPLRDLCNCSARSSNECWAFQQLCRELEEALEGHEGAPAVLELVRQIICHAVGAWPQSAPVVWEVYQILPEDPRVARRSLEGPSCRFLPKGARGLGS